MREHEYAGRASRIDAWLARNPWSALLMIAAQSSAMYAWATRFPYRAPYDIAPTWLDKQMPYLAWTIPLYLTYFLVLPAFALLNGHTAAFAPIFRRAFLYVTCNLGIAVAIPTRVHPWGVAQQDGILAALIQAYDTPLAAVPSGHVGLPCCLWLASWRFGGKHPWLFRWWTLLLAVCILTTKQHYCWDLVTGLILGAAIALAPHPGAFQIARRRVSTR